MISRPHPDISRTRQHFRRFAPVLVAGISLFAWSCSEDTPSSPEAPQLTPPAPTSVVEVTSPPRGGMVQDGTLDVSPISLSGSAYDSVSTVTSLTIGGQSVSLSGTPPCLDFTTQMDSRWGLNIITGSARNEAGTTMTLAQSYLRAHRRHRGEVAGALPGCPRPQVCDPDGGCYTPRGEDLQ